MEDTLENKLCKPILITVLSPQDGSSPLVTTTFRLNYLTKIRLTIYSTKAKIQMRQ